VRLIFSDVDGTLLNPQQLLTTRVEAAINMAAAVGVPVRVCKIPNRPQALHPPVLHMHPHPCPAADSDSDGQSSWPLDTRCAPQAGF
jgi:hypothetical protein